MDLVAGMIKQHERERFPKANILQLVTPDIINKTNNMLVNLNSKSGKNASLDPQKQMKQELNFIRKARLDTNKRIETRR